MPTKQGRTIPTCGHPHRKHNGNGKCKSCFNKRYKKTKDQSKRHAADYRARHPEKVRERSRISNNKKYQTTEGKAASRSLHLKKRFGISDEAYFLLLLRQQGVCKICRKYETATRNGVVKHLAIDHDHKTGKIRGLLCQRCNTMIGYANDDPDILKSAVGYLGKC